MEKEWEEKDMEVKVEGKDLGKRERVLVKEVQKDFHFQVLQEKDHLKEILDPKASREAREVERQDLKEVREDPMHSQATAMNADFLDIPPSSAHTLGLASRGTATTAGSMDTEQPIARP